MTRSILFRSKTLFFKIIFKHASFCESSRMANKKHQISIFLVIIYFSMCRKTIDAFRSSSVITIFLSRRMIKRTSSYMMEQQFLLIRGRKFTAMLFSSCQWSIHHGRLGKISKFLYFHPGLSIFWDNIATFPAISALPNQNWFLNYTKLWILPDILSFFLCLQIL